MTAREISERVRPLCSFSFARSGGPGGQNVNKVASKVTARLSLCDLPFLTAGERARVEARLSHRIGAGGYLAVTVQDTRDQSRNREIAVERIGELIAAAMRKPKARRKTRPSAASREARLRAKKRRGADKRLRVRASEE
jgi:ribosome-associated protein